MPSTLHLLSVIPFLGAALAVPAPTTTAAAPPAYTTVGPPLLRTKDFGVVLHAPDGPSYLNGLVLRTNPSSIIGNDYLSFERPSAFTPSPAYLNGTADELNDADKYAYLNFAGSSADNGDFGARLPQAGDAPGAVYRVESIFGAQNAAWKQSGTSLVGKMDAALNGFFACNQTVTPANQGETAILGLSFGNPKADGTNPDGCVRAELEIVDLAE